MVSRLFVRNGKRSPGRLSEILVPELTSNWEQTNVRSGLQILSRGLGGA